MGAALTLLATLPAFAAEPLPTGAYEVTYRLEMPHVDQRGETAATVCLSRAGDTAGFPILSPNNPLAKCPVVNLRREGDEVSFDVVCPGGNSAKAHALFDLVGDGFQGRIAMNMGGKNMTMTEVQRGRRIGPCADEVPTR